MADPNTDDDPHDGAAELAAAKRALRRSALDRRRARPATEIARARAAITDHLMRHLAGSSTIAGYLPLPTEPLDPALIPALHSAGCRVLLPLAVADSALDWAEADGRIGAADGAGAIGSAGGVQRGQFGIDEPTGTALGVDAVATADVVLVPALLVDSRGTRLGRGGGHYDRTLAAATGELIAVVFDDELVDELHAGPFDLPVTAVVTPAGGLQRRPL